MLSSFILLLKLFRLWQLATDNFFRMVHMPLWYTPIVFPAPALETGIIQGVLFHSLKNGI